MAVLPLVLFAVAATPAPSPSSGVAAQTAKPGAAAAALSAELEQLRSEYAVFTATPAALADPVAAEAYKRAASRLMSLLASRINVEEAPSAAVEAPVPLALPGSPPHQTGDVDRLRDQLDGLTSQRAALLPLAANLDNEVEAAVAQRRKAAEALRLRQELVERAHGEAEIARAREALQLARLEDRTAELEVVRADGARSDVQARVAALAEPIVELERRIEPARRAQHITPEELLAVRESATAVRGRIAAERARLLQQIEQAEERAATTGAGSDRALKSLRDTVLALGELDAVEGGRIAVWEQRLAALQAQAGDAAAQQAAATALQRSVDQARAHARAVGERLELLKSEARVQRTPMDSLPGAQQATAGDPGAAAALQGHIDVEEQLQRTLNHLATLLQRSHADLVAGQPAATTPRTVERLGDAIADAMRRLWQYELFSATETMRVDGRAVTLDYGVTVGKSLGVLLLFVLGWWAAAKLANALIGAMVSRGRMSEALGRVLKRWLVTVLLLAVLVVVLKLARVPLAAFAFLGGALAIGVGFGTQNMVKNLISGVIILFERKIRVGDVVTIGAVSGTVKAVDLRASTLLGFDGIETILPNSHLLENLVADWSHGDRRIRSTLRVTVDIDAAPETVAARMLACAQAHPSVLQQPAPEVLFDDIDPTGLVFKLWYWVEVGGPQAGPSIGSELRFAITRDLRAQGVRFGRARHDVELALTDLRRGDEVRRAMAGKSLRRGRPGAR